MADSPPIVAGPHPERLSDPGQGIPYPGPWQPPEVEELGPEFPMLSIHALLGRGGMGAVYRATQPELEREVALKVLPRELGADAGFIERFRLESRLLAGLKHPGLVAVYDCGETRGGFPYHLMEYIPGGDLAQRLKSSPMPLAKAVTLVGQVAAAVAHAHAAGLVHRDLKPASILLAKDGQAKVADFGLGRPASQQPDALSRPSHSDLAAGTPEYAAPEQLDGGVTQPGPEADVYSLGMIAYEALTGRVPHGVFSPASGLNPEVDVAFDAVILRAIQGDPKRRFPDAAAFREAWTLAATHRERQCRRDEEAREKLARRTRLAAVFGGVALLAAGAAVHGLVQQRAAEKQTLRAEAGRVDSDRLMGLLMDRLADKMVSVGRVDLLEDVDEELARHFDPFKAAAGTASGERRGVFLTHRVELLRLLGRMDEAMAAAREAEDLLVPAVKSAPGSVSAFQNAAQALTGVMQMHQRRGEFAEGVRAAERLVNLAETTLPGLPPDDKNTLSLAHSHRTAGECLTDLQHLEDAAAHLKQAQAVLVPLLATAPPAPEALAASADNHQALGAIEEKRRDWNAALAAFEKGIADCRRSQDPRRWLFTQRHQLASLLGRTANIHHWRRDFAAARPLIEEALPILTEIDRRSPGSTQALSQKRYLYNLWSENLDSQGRTAEAQRAMAESKSALKELQKLGAGKDSDAAGR